MLYKKNIFIFYIVIIMANNKNLLEWKKEFIGFLYTNVVFQKLLKFLKQISINIELKINSHSTKQEN